MGGARSELLFSFSFEQYREITSDNLWHSSVSAAPEWHTATESQDEQGSEQNESEAFGKSSTIDSLHLVLLLRCSRTDGEFTKKKRLTVGFFSDVTS